MENEKLVLGYCEVLRHLSGIIQEKERVITTLAESIRQAPEGKEGVMAQSSKFALHAAGDIRDVIRTRDGVLNELKDVLHVVDAEQSLDEDYALLLKFRGELA